MQFLKTRDITYKLGIPYHRLEYLHRTNKLPRPMQDSSGDRIYTEQDIKRIREVLKTKDRTETVITGGTYGDKY